MRKLTTFIIASAIALSSSTLVYAAEVASTAPSDTVSSGTSAAPVVKNSSEKEEQNKEWQKGKSLFAGLELTVQQRQQLHDLMKDMHKDKDRDAAMKTQYETLHQFIIAEKFDDAQAQAKIAEFSKTQSEHMLERLRIENKMYNLLTPEQKAKFNQNFEKREAKMSKHHKKEGAE